MKQLAFTLMLFVIVLSPLAAACQKAPATPTGQGQRSVQPPPADGQSQPPRGQSVPPSITPPDGQWQKIERLPVGVLIVVSSTYGPPIPCRFAAATNDALFCDAPESPGGTGWQFERSSVVSVEATILKKNWHPGLVGAMIAGGTLVGLAATHGASAGRAAGIGAIGAVITGAVGAPMALSQPDERWVTVVYRPRFARRTPSAGPQRLP